MNNKKLFNYSSTSNSSKPSDSSTSNSLASSVLGVILIFSVIISLICDCNFRTFRRSRCCCCCCSEVSESTEGNEKEISLKSLEKDTVAVMVCKIGILFLPGVECEKALSKMEPLLPVIFEKFLKENGIDPLIYDRPQTQFFTTNTFTDFVEIDRDTGGRAQPVNFLPVQNFYKIKANSSGNGESTETVNKFHDEKGHIFRFSTSQLYQQGQLLPMDLSSGLVVWLLNIKPSDHVLDLCCAPGSKFILASWLQNIEKNTDWSEMGTITGVDLAGHRLATCRSMIKKFKVARARLFCTDGSSFNEPVREFIVPNQISECENTNPGLILKPFHESTAFRKRPSRLAAIGLYDKVMVDVQCTHDGSVKHIRKHRQNNWTGFDVSQFETEHLTALQDLQLSLLENGFRLLKPGGIIVYSTCSLTRGQNEDIIEKFMKNRSGVVDPLPFEGSDEFGQLRLSPPTFDSGFFICRLMKRHS